MVREKNDHLVGSGNVRVRPEFRDSPDIEKLGRALIAAAVNIAEKKRAEEKALLEGKEIM